jgi:hypothetical protein
MPETSTTQAADDAAVFVLRLDAAEHALVMASLRLLISILGRDEAEELAKAQALLDRMGSRRAE